MNMGKRSCKLLRRVPCGIIQLWGMNTFVMRCGLVLGLSSKKTQRSCLVMAVSNVWSCPLPALFAGPVEPNKAHHYMASVKATRQQKLSLITKVKS